MATQSGATVRVILSEPSEDSAAAPINWELQRFTDRNGPSLEVGELTSNEVSANRQETSIRSGFQQVSGQLGFELSHLSQDRLIELATAEEFVANPYMGTTTTDTVVTTGGTAAWTDSSSTLVLAEASIETGFNTGDEVSFFYTTASGFFYGHGSLTTGTNDVNIVVRSGNLLDQGADLVSESLTVAGKLTEMAAVTWTGPSGPVPGFYTITNAIAGDVGLVGAFIVDDGSGALHKFVGRVGTASVAGDRLYVMVEISGTGATGFATNVVGNQQISRVRKDTMLYSAIEKQYPEAGASGLYQTFTGCTVNNLSMSIQPGSLVTGTADILGISAGVMESGASGNTGAAAPTSTAYSPFSSCVGIDDGPNAVVSGLDFTINNNRETVPLLCSPFANDVYEGVANVSGTATLLFEDADEYNRFQSEDETTLTVALKSVAGSSDDMMIVHFPRVRYTQPSFEIPANGPVVLTLNFRSLESDYPGAPVVPCSAVIIKTA